MIITEQCRRCGGLDCFCSHSSSCWHLRRSLLLTREKLTPSDSRPLTNFVIATVGLAGVGKSTVTNLLTQQLCVEPIYFGGQVVQLLERNNVEVTEGSERQLRESLRAEYGPGAIAVLSMAEIRHSLDEHRIALIDGLYSPEELNVLEEQTDSEIYLIAIHSHRYLREARMVKRPLRPLDPTELRSRDDREVGFLGKAIPITLADFHVVNNTTIAHLEEQISPILKRWLGWSNP